MKFFRLLGRLFTKPVDAVPDVPSDDQLPEKFRCITLTPPADGRRVETGVVRFGDSDWPGVFMRGDYAMYSAHLLRKWLKEFQHDMDDLELMQLINLLETMESCNVRGLPIEGYRP